MTTQLKGPLAGFEWLQRGVSVGFRHPKPIYGGAVILLLVALVPTLITLPIQFHSAIAGTPPSPGLVVGIMVASMLVGLLLVPVYAGYLQVIDAADRGDPTSVTGLFSPYRRGEAPRLIVFGVALLVIYVALVAIVVLAAGRGIVTWYMQVLAAQGSHLAPPALPAGFGTAMALFTVMALFMTGFYSVSLGQVALRRHGVLNAIGDGFLGALKNLLPLLVLAVCGIIASIAVGVVLVIFIAIVAMLSKLFGVWLIFALVIPVYLALMLVMLAVAFGVMYYLWRDVCEGDASSDPAQSFAA